MRAGTVAIVVGSEGPYSHAVFGVGEDLVDAHKYVAQGVRAQSELGVQFVNGCFDGICVWVGGLGEGWGCDFRDAWEKR